MRGWLAIPLAVGALVLSACGSGGTDTTKPAPPPVSAATAGHLAKLSDRVASDLDAGDICDAAHVADDLKAAVEESDLPANLRPGVDAVAGDLVDQVNCPPPPPPPPAEKKPEKPHGEHPGGGRQEGDHQGSEQKPKPPGHGGKVPPGKAKLEGEPG